MCYIIKVERESQLFLPFFFPYSAFPILHSLFLSPHSPFRIQKSPRNSLNPG